MDAKQYNIVVTVISALIMAFLGLSGLGFVPVGKHLAIDFLIIPAILTAIITNMRCAILIGIAWGLIAFISPGYLPEYYPPIAALIPRVFVSMLSSLLFKKNYRFNNNLTLFFIVISFIHIISEIITNHFFNIYEYYNIPFSYVTYLFELIIKKSIPEFIFLISFIWVMKKKFRISIEGLNDIRIKSI